MSDHGGELCLTSASVVTRVGPFLTAQETAAAGCGRRSWICRGLIVSSSRDSTQLLSEMGES